MSSLGAFSSSRSQSKSNSAANALETIRRFIANLELASLFFSRTLPAFLYNSINLAK
jgi:hypothetical protein